MFLCGTYSQIYSQTRQAAGSPSLSREREGHAGRRRGSPSLLIVSTWCGEMGGARQPFMLFPRVGSSRPLADSASCPLHGLEVLFHCGPILGTA